MEEPIWMVIRPFGSFGIIPSEITQCWVQATNKFCHCFRAAIHMFSFSCFYRVVLLLDAKIMKNKTLLSGHSQILIKEQEMVQDITDYIFFRQICKFVSCELIFSNVLMRLRNNGWILLAAIFVWVHFIVGSNKNPDSGRWYFSNLY